MKTDSRTHALLATARIANVPSVVSNLGVGVLLGCTVEGSRYDWPWLLSLAAVLFYISGNFLNDWADRDWDRKNRPERALPRGLFPASAYFSVAAGGMSAGLVICAFHGVTAFVVAAILVALIVQYTRVHKRAAWSVIPMGLCRACLPLLGYAAMRGGIAGPAVFPAVALLLYIIGLSLSARWEARGNLPEREKFKARGLLFGSGLVAAVLPVLILPALGWLGLVPFAAWLLVCLGKYQSPVPTHVSALLAGIPLVDWISLLPMGLIWFRWERVGAGDPMFLAAMILAPVCFVAGRLLQRLAPAT